MKDHKFTDGSTTFVVSRTTYQNGERVALWDAANERQTIHMKPKQALRMAAKLTKAAIMAKRAKKRRKARIK